MTALSGWQYFYVIVGSSAGALIGLQFVVITLVADMPNARGLVQAADAFATPTIVHFGAVLLLAAVLNAPWRGTGAPAVLWSLVGLSGVVYTVIVTQRLRVQSAYQPVFEDWMFHALLPCVAYAMLVGSAYVARSHVREALFGLGAAVLLLLFTGIHNAWDAVIYHVFVNKQEQSGGERQR